MWSIPGAPTRHRKLPTLSALKSSNSIIEGAGPRNASGHLTLCRSVMTGYKLSLFRRGAGRFECRTEDQDESMCDMEVHEHVMISGKTRTLEERILHRNVENLSRYIQKHNEYSNWEVRVSNDRAVGHDQLEPSLWGSQAERRRWLRKNLLGVPGSPALFFLYRYVLRLGFLDGVPGLIYCGFQAIQFFHVKAKLYEAKVASRSRLGTDVHEMSAQDQNYVRH